MNGIEIKGLHGSGYTRFSTGGPFYMEFERLARIGSVTTRPDVKQGTAHYT